jgi:hypothetical protein
MRKQPGVVSRCRPSFDFLEERALLSGGHPGSPVPGDMFWSSQPHAIHSESMTLGRSGSDGPPWLDAGWSGSHNDSWLSQPAGSTDSQPDHDVPPQSTGSPLSQQTVVGPLFPSSAFSQSKPESAPGLESPTGIGAGPGSPATAVASGQTRTTELEPAGTISLDSEPAGSAANSADSGWARLVSQGEASESGNELVGSGRVQGSLTASGHRGATNTSRGALLSTAYVSIDGNDGSSPGEWPRPSSADLIASALPFDRAALDRAIDVFFQQFDDLGRGDMTGQRPAYIVMYSIALASTFAALDVVRRRWRLTATGIHIRVRHPQVTADHIGFPELPGSWSSRAS